MKQGFYVLLFDAYGHGELKTLKDDNSYEINELLKVYLETSKYINQVINFYKHNNGFGDFNRVGLLGFSMGAHTIYYYITRERQMGSRAAVPVIGSPSWVSFVRRFIKSIKELEGLYEERKITEIEYYISKIQPLNFISNIKDFPLLIINGEIDERIQIEDIREFYKNTYQLYDNKENIRFIEHKGVGHKVTEEMLNSTIKWFIRYL